MALAWTRYEVQYSTVLCYTYLTLLSLPTHLPKVPTYPEEWPTGPAKRPPSFPFRSLSTLSLSLPTTSSCLIRVELLALLAEQSTPLPPPLLAPSLPPWIPASLPPSHPPLLRACVRLCWGLGNGSNQVWAKKGRGVLFSQLIEGGEKKGKNNRFSIPLFFLYFHLSFDSATPSAREQAWDLRQPHAQRLFLFPLQRPVRCCAIHFGTPAPWLSFLSAHTLLHSFSPTISRHVVSLTR